ncbi:PAS domain-containing sensor histidine kinase [Pontibacter diazotrophicus]|uniref:histidine kinase n=1 Tax=Pontibacter diazotrophicus TaxID=1400979 RepID=A0A3D8LDJ5_9BACT|nr:PAS domain-containing protein [Pontibacter diazotrophicus]RDV15475.1 PAS domain-containing sensor histidine kinase [Pontibacter diazotrophicus]
MTSDNSSNSSLDFLLTLTEGTDQVVFAFDIAATRFTFLNPAFEKVWNRSRISIMDNSASLWQDIHPEDKLHVQQVYHELLEGVLVSELEFRIILRNKSERWVCLMPRVTEEQLIIGYAQDITAQKEYYDVLKKFSDKKNAILNILSHDLSGPLAMIQSLSTMLRDDVKADTDHQQMQRVISIIERSSQQGMQLIQDFIKQEFLESANVELIKRRVNLVGMLRESMDEYLLNPLLPQKTFHFVTSADTVFLYLDDTKFMQAINNLLSNAIKFTPDGGEITLALEEKEETVLIKITDTGIGIPEKYHDTLFDKFTRARRPGIKGEPSVGLGMSIIKTIVEWHQGRIWFESQENKGTIFFIEVPKNQ